MESQDEFFYRLLSLKVSGEATSEELREFDDLLKENPQWGLEVEMISEVWKQNQSPEVIPNAFDKHLQRLSNHLTEPAMQYELPTVEQSKSFFRPGIIRKILRATCIAAASVMIIFAIDFLIDSNKNTSATLKNSVSTRMGSKSKIVLPDGTQVWLNSGSNLTYDQDFLGSKRVVTLSGEAYFDVVKDKKRPFIIHTEKIDIKVLGTAFNVRSYPSDKTTETSLIRGSVEIFLRDSPEKSIVLKPNEKLIVQNVSAIARKNRGSVDNTLKEISVLTLSHLHPLKNDTSTVETSWVKNVLAFDNEPLHQVASKIERWFDVKISIEDEKLKEETYSSVFEEESLIEVLDALKMTGQFNYTTHKREVYIYK